MSPASLPDGPAANGQQPNRRVAATGLLILASVYTLSAAKALFVPIAFALLFSFALQPVMRFFGRFGLPRPLRALMAVWGLIGLVVLALVLTLEPALDALDRLPQTAPRIGRQLEGIKERLETLRQTTEEVKQMTKGDPSTETNEVEITKPGFIETFINAVPGLVSGAVATFFLLYFLLCSGNFFVRKTTALLGETAAKRRLVTLVRAVEADMVLYMRTAVFFHCGVGLATGIALYFLGMPEPAFGGILAGVFNFIPYLGPAVTFLFLGILALMSITNPAQALLVPLTYGAITAIDGQLLQPLILGKRLDTSPVTVLLSLMLWGWLWGLAGLFLAVPLLLALRRVCESIPYLNNLALLLRR